MGAENRKSLIKWIILLVAVVAVAVVMMLVFSNKVKKKAREQVLAEIADIASDNATRFHDDLMGVTMSGQAAARQIAGKEDMSPEEAQRILEALVYCTPLYRAIYYIGDTVIAGSDEDTPDVTQFEVPEGARKADINVYFYLPAGEVADQGTVLVMLPVTGTAGRLLLYYPIDRITTLFSDTRNVNYGQELFSAVTDNSGAMLYRGKERSAFLEGDTLWDNINKDDKGKIDGVKGRMRNIGKGNVSLSVGKEKRTLVYAAIPVSSWLVVKGVSQEYLDRCAEQEWKETGRMFYLLLAVAAIAVLYIFIANLDMRRENLKENKGLQEKADTDLLTGLNNKLATERKIKEYMGEHPDTLSMMFVLDIDNFKNINDTMGHAFGDEVLRELGIYIGSNFRVTDIIGRTGGDEFTIFLKALKDDASIRKEAQKLVYFFNNFQVGEYTKYSVTASIGAAIYPADGGEFEALYKSADKALYKAKKRGKNQLAFYDDRDRKEDAVQNVQ